MSNLRAAAAAAFVTTTLLALPAAADLVPDGKTYAPLHLTLDNQAAFADTTMVVLGCNSVEGGRHQVAFAKPTEPLKCSIKLPPTVYAVANKDVKPLQDLVAKDLGWAAEGIEARKLLDKKPSCGTIEETTLVDKSKNVGFLTARYALEKTASGCSVKKVGETITQASAASGTPAASGSPSGSGSAETPPAASGSGSASASSSSSPAASGSASPTTKTGGCGSCTAVGTQTGSNSGGPLAAFLGLVLAGVIAGRRRRGAKRNDGGFLRGCRGRSPWR